MVVAVAVVGMVQVTVDEVVDMVAVGNRRMSTVRAVDVACVVPLALVGCAPVGIVARDLDDVFVVVIFMSAVEMPVVEVPHVISVFHGNMATVWPMRVIVILVDFGQRSFLKTEKFPSRA